MLWGKTKQQQYFLISRFPIGRSPCCVRLSTKMKAESRMRSAICKWVRGENPSSSSSSSSSFSFTWSCHHWHHITASQVGALGIAQGGCKVQVWGANLPPSPGNSKEEHCYSSSVQEWGIHGHPFLTLQVAFHCSLYLETIDVMLKINCASKGRFEL